jgi:hypothetical protein
MWIDLSRQRCPACISYHASTEMTKEQPSQPVDVNQERALHQGQRRLGNACAYFPIGAMPEHYTRTPRWNFRAGAFSAAAEREIGSEAMAALDVRRTDPIARPASGEAPGAPTS